MSRFDAALTAAEQKYGLPSGLLHGLMRTESGGNPNAVSPKGAIGLMQFMPATAKQFGIDPRDPMQAIDGAARYMSQNLKASKGDVATALRLYQGGPDVSRHGPENAAYAGKVMAAMPGESGDLTAMGFNAPAANDDMKDAGFTPPPIDDVKKARGELAAFIPANKAITQGINAVITQGVAAKKTRAQIKQDVAEFNTAHGLQDGPTENLDTAIDYHMKGGKGIIPVVQPGSYKPLSNTKTMLAGLKQGVEDVEATPDRLAQAAERAIPSLTTLNNKLGLATADQAAAIHGADRDLYNQTLGDNTLANVGRIGGNIAMTAPVMGAVNPLVTRGAGALAEAVPGAVPVASFLAGNGGGNLLARTGSAAANGALQGAEGAVITSGGNDASLLDQIEMGGLAGAVLGPGGKLLSAGAGKVGEALAPKVNPIVAQLAQKAVNAGIDLRGSQISGSPFVKTVDSVLARVPGSGVAGDNAAQRAQFTRAVGRTFGADADNLTPQVMTSAKSGISKVYRDVAARTNINAGGDVADALSQISHDYGGVLDTNKVPALDRLLENVRSKITPNGVIPGETFQSLTNKGSMLDKATQDGNSSFANAAKEIKSILNGALESSATAEDAAALKQADWQWKNMRTVEKLIASSPDGTISPATLNSRVSTSFGNRAYTGAGDLGDLADIGQRFLKDQSSSNTAERSQIFNFLLQHGAGLAGGVGSMLGYHAGLDPLYAAGAGIGTMAGTSGLARITGKVLSRDAYRNRLLSAALDDDKTGGVVAPWLAQNLVPLTVAGSNRLLTKGSDSRSVAQ